MEGAVLEGSLEVMYDHLASPPDGNPPLVWEEGLLEGGAHLTYSPGGRYSIYNFATGDGAEVALVILDEGLEGGGDSEARM